MMVESNLGEVNIEHCRSQKPNAPKVSASCLPPTSQTPNYWLLKHCSEYALAPKLFCTMLYFDAG